MKYILYHARCADGLGAAWVAWQKLGVTDTEYIPVSYGERLPIIEDGAEVYILDFSYPREVLIELGKRSQSVVVLDHHASAEKDLAGLDLGSLSCVKFEKNKSGAVMAWEYFFDRDPIPMFLQYIQDRDLWTWKLPCSREVSAYIHSFPKTLEAFDSLSRMESHDMAAAGAHILRATDQLADNQARHAVLTYHNRVRLAWLNCTTLQSETAHRILQLFPEAEYAALYVDEWKGGSCTRRVSLRSRKGGFDVSALAKEFGGGGHVNAAGMELDHVPIFPDALASQSYPVTALS